jgi:hypothetical protein
MDIAGLVFELARAGVVVMCLVIGFEIYRAVMTHHSNSQQSSLVIKWD